MCQGLEKRMNLNYMGSAAKGGKDGDKRKDLSLEIELLSKSYGICAQC